MPLTDQHERDLAIIPSRSFIVQAPAGSGKTGLLVRRLLSLLCVVEKPEEILAITFTRKATAEMRDRVIKALETSKTGGNFEPHEQDLAAMAQKALARDRDMQWLLLEQPHRLRIQTIDSLCTELVRKMPWSTRFGGVPQVETDLQNLYQKAATALLKRLDSTNMQTALSTLLFYNSGDTQTLKSRLANMLYQREKWLTLIFRKNALKSRVQIEQSWRSIIVDAVDRLDTTCGAALARELLELRRYAEENRAASSTPLNNEQLRALMDDTHQPQLETRIIQWRLIADLLLKIDGELRKTVNKNNGFPRKDRHKTRMLEILKALQGDVSLHQAVADFMVAPDPTLSEDDWQQLQALEQVLPALAQELYVQMAENNCADYDELSRRAIDALGTEDHPTDLALIQDYRIKHILMDEFQDTSTAQKALLQRLTAGWQHQEQGRSLFLVGDPMQSIYGFRNADVRVFLEVRDKGINDIRPEPLELKVNFRSSPDIINWVNRVMPNIFPEKDEPELARVRYTPSVAQLHHQGTIQTHLCIADSAQTSDQYRHAEALLVQAHIQSIRQRHPGDSIAVLARKRTPLAYLAGLLRKNDTEFEAVDLETLSEQSLVHDLISLAGIFINPMDSLAWLAVLRAPWCGLTLADLTRLRDNGEPLHKLARENIADAELSGDGSVRLQQLRRMLKAVHAAARQKHITDLLRRAWLSLHGPACYEPHELVHVEPFFEMLDVLESQTEPLSREHLLEKCSLHSASSPASTLQLMTFHKAKGLEFDHVILTGLADVSSGDTRQQPLLQSCIYHNVDLVACSSLASDTGPSKAGFISQHLRSIEEEEAVRLVYVAATRARKHLAMFATLKRNQAGKMQAPRKGSLLRLLWPELESSFMKPENQSEAPNLNNTGNAEQTQSPGVSLQRLPASIAPCKLPAPIQINSGEVQTTYPEIEFDWAQEEARIIGLVVHALLEHSELDMLKRAYDHVDQSVIVAKLGQHGIDPDRLKAVGKRVLDILTTISTDQRAHWIFNPDHRQIRSEWTLSSGHKDSVTRHVIDRSFVDREGVRWIIDFKTSSHEGGDLQHFLDEEEKRYSEQLDRYAELVQKLEPDRKIKLGLYFPALGQWRERHYCPVKTA